MKSLKNYIINESINESLLATTIATSMAMSNSDSKDYSDVETDNSSTLAKWLSRGLRTIFVVGAGILGALSTPVAGVAALVCLCLAISFNYSELIDKHILKESNEEENINEGVIDKIKQGLIKFALKNKKLHQYFEDITKREDFKKSKEKNSLKDMIQSVTNYFKENTDELECKKLEKELKKEG